MPLSSVVGAQSIIKPGVCTSSTRPAVPFEGQMIYETDTDKVLVWNGSDWYPNWNLPWGVVGAVQSVAGNLTVTKSFADVTGSSITWTAVAGRTYKFTANASALKNTSESWVYLTVTTSANAQIGSGVYASAAAGEYANLSFSGYATGITAGSQTHKLRTICGAATATLVRSGSDYLSFFIEDIGPA